MTEEVKIAREQLRLENAKLMVEKQRNTIQWVSLAVTIGVAFFAATQQVQTLSIQREIEAAKGELEERKLELETIANELNAVRVGFEERQLGLNHGSSRSAMMQAALPYLEASIKSDIEPKERERACNVVLRISDIEISDLKSDHINKLHAKYLELSEGLYPKEDGSKRIPACISNATDLGGELEAQTLTGTGSASPDDHETLSDQVVVLASYRRNNCHIAEGALTILREHFNIYADQIFLAHSRSGHYSVVYSPGDNDVPTRQFLSLARADGVRAKEAVASGQFNSIDKSQIQFVAEAYVISTAGWKKVENCSEL